MFTYQDMLSEPDVKAFVIKAINNHKSTSLYKTAVIADQYDRKKNVTIQNYVQTIFTLTGSPVEDFTASNNKICSNFFHRLNTQRNTYLLGNGVSFSEHMEDIDGVSVDTTKERLGSKFDG